jgi:hypothetical protein
MRFQHSGWHTEDPVTKFQISRVKQDEWALRSHKRFSAAQTAGKFADEIVQVEVPGRKGPSTFKADEHNRPDTTIEALAKLKPVFRDGGTITAGITPPMIGRSQFPGRNHHPRDLARSCFRIIPLEAKSAQNGSNSERAWLAPSREVVGGLMMLSQVD